MEIQERFGPDLDAATLYALLRLRLDIFVVEQACPFHEIDGWDLEPGVRHCWLEEAGEVVACVRIRPDRPGLTSIGRICTAPRARGRGLAGALVEHALGTTRGPVRLTAQVQLTEWYARFGFRSVGDSFDEDGLRHVEMHLDR